MAARRHPLRSHIVALFKRGELSSVREAVLICDASRQAVTRWLKSERIDIEARRLAFIARQRSQAQRQLEGLPAVKRPTKAQMRKAAERALKVWNARK